MNDYAKDCVFREAVKRTANNVPEIDNQWVARNRTRVRLVDVRETSELAGPLGVLPDVENVPLKTLTGVARDWERTDAIVVLCRSGGRSARAARDLEALGFQCVASMEGGMMLWRELGLPQNDLLQRSATG